MQNSVHASTMEAHHNFHSVHPCCGWFWCEIPRQITLQLYNIYVKQTLQHCHQLGGWSLLWHHPTLEPQEVISLNINDSIRQQYHKNTTTKNPPAHNTLPTRPLQ